jgi:hypothetical protein
MAVPPLADWLARFKQNGEIIFPLSHRSLSESAAEHACMHAAPQAPAAAWSETWTPVWPFHPSRVVVPRPCCQKVISLKRHL